MKTEIVTLREFDLWKNYFHLLPSELQDVYFLPEYHHLCEANGDGEAVLFIVQTDMDIFYYPFMLRRINSVGNQVINRPLKDIETVYGYTGPLVTNNEPLFGKGSIGKFDDYCQEEHVVTEFIRFNPLICNQIPFKTIFGKDLTNIREYVWVNLANGLDRIWNGSFSKKNRNTIRKAIKSGVVVIKAHNWGEFTEFVSLYLHNMHKLGADEKYYFSMNYFRNLFDFIKQFGSLFISVYRDEIIGASVFLKYGNYSHYHLSATNEIGRKFGVSNWLLFKGIQWAVEEGAIAMHLGGGMSESPNDSLLKFKAAFSPLRSQFCIGKRVHNIVGYHLLVKKWKLCFPEKEEEYSKYFQIYRTQPKI